MYRRECHSRCWTVMMSILRTLLFRTSRDTPRVPHCAFSHVSPRVPLGVLDGWDIHLKLVDCIPQDRVLVHNIRLTLLLHHCNPCAIVAEDLHLEKCEHRLLHLSARGSIFCNQVTWGCLTPVPKRHIHLPSQPTCWSGWLLKQDPQLRVELEWNEE